MNRIDTLLSFDALEQLEQQAAAYWTKLHVPDSVHRASEITASVPAFLVRSRYPLLYVCFPTYQVNIPFPRNDPKCDGKLELLLQNVSHRSRLQADSLDCAIVNNRYVQLEFPPKCCTTVCLGENLRQNAAIRDELVAILERENIRHTVFPVYQYRVVRIKFLEDGDSFTVRR